MTDHIVVRLVAVAALTLCCAGASRGATGVNLVSNPGFDAAPGGNGDAIVAAPSWTAVGNPTVVRWDAGGGFPAVSDPGPSDRGSNFVSGGPSSPLTSFFQDIDVSADAVLIDTGTQGFTLAGYLGGYASQNDNAVLSVEFLNANGDLLGSTTLSGPLAAGRQNLTGLLLTSAVGIVPPQTRTARVTVTFERQAGSYNDGYADSLSLVLTPPAACSGDFNHDGAVNTADLVSFLGKFGQSVAPGTPQDMNADGVVNTLDLTRFLGRFGQPCP
jgi:hypothetical protein